MASKLNKNKVITAAQKYVQKGQYDKAIREYSKIVEEDPRDVRIWLKIGDLQAKKNAKKEAVDTYTKVAEFYSEQGFYLKAVAVYKQILKIDNTLVEINLRLAELYKQLGLLSDAMQQYEQVSNHYNQIGRTKDALAALRQIVDLDPEYVASRIKLAELYSKENMREEAVEEFSKAADFLRADNRIDDFVKVAERLVFHQAENLAVSRELAGIYLQKNDPRRALQKLQLAFKADPRDVDTLVMLAKAFEDLGQVAKTVSVLKELANIHLENGQVDLQRQTYEQILGLSPADEDAKKALEQMQFAQPEPDYASPHQPAEPEPIPDYQDQGEAGIFPDQEAPPPYPQEADESMTLPESSEYEPNVTFDGAESYEVHGSTYDEPETFIDDPFESPRDYDLPPKQPEQPVEALSSPINVDAPEHLDESDFQLYDEPAAATPPTANYQADDPEIDVAKIITEADVYVKYGLQDKALGHLLQVFDADPNNLDAHLKLKELYVQMNRVREAARELVFLSQLYQESDKRVAAIYLNEALELDPDNPEARSLLNQLEGSEVAELEQPYADDDFADMEPIDLDAADIVEEIPIDSEDLLDASDLTPITADEEMTDYSTDPGGQDGWHQDGYVNEDPYRPQGGLQVSDTLSGEELDSMGVIEVEGEVTDTLGLGTPSSEVIQLGAKPRPSDSQVRAYQEEESTRIEDDLEEAEFFIQQNLISEAQAILEEVTSRVPNHPLVVAKLAEVAALEQRLKAEGAGGDVMEDSALNLADELAATDFSDLGPIPESNAVGGDEYSVEDVFEEFKRGPESQGSEEDSDTHYDLGIAYREMGLLDDAITEFKVAMRSRDKEVLCHMMIGLCYIQKDMISEAISQFKTGLYVEGITDRETIALYFELGQAYENLDDLREALYYYEKVAKKDPRFRDVANRVQQIQSQNKNLVDDNGGGSHDPSDGDVVSKVL